ncbi:MAG: bifunctional adenosylcobinamide kinase/adenosylcobinamide-phosphate guanylyltransferase [Alphaproteobacteria bacterium]
MNWPPRAEDDAIDTKEESALRPVTLVLGGAASGKSRHAETLIEAGFGTSWTGATYIATAHAGDAEMIDRIKRHRRRRGDRWQTVEEPLALAFAIAKHAAPNRPVLVDCLTLWITNVMLADRDADRETRHLVDTLAGLAGPVVIVANEVGLGVVPANPLARAFRDMAGNLNQAVAAAADRVQFMAAGLPLTLKDN